jgi:transposase-like protein
MELMMADERVVKLLLDGARTTVDIGRELGVPADMVRRAFIRWCRLNGVNYYDYVVLIRRKVEAGELYYKLVLIPNEAVEWVKNDVMSRRGRLPGNKGANLRMKLGDRVITVTDVARKFGISRRWTLREFKRWCERNGKTSGDFFRQGLGYLVPEEFIEHIRTLVEKGVVKPKAE